MNSSSVKNYLQRDGFVMVSNLLITYQDELGINDKQLNFIIKIMKNKADYKLHDSKLDPRVSTRTLQRRRKELKELGLLNYKVWKYSDEQGHIYTEGITYDLSPLEEKLQSISDILEKERVRVIEKEAEDYIIEYDEDSPMYKYLKDWEEHYGDCYKLNTTEKKWYNSLNEEEQKYISKIFDYCEDNKLFGSIVPRLTLFIKNKLRFTQLKDYYLSNVVEVEERYYSVLEEDRELTVAEKVKLALSKDNL